MIKWEVVSECTGAAVVNVHTSETAARSELHGMNRYGCNAPGGCKGPAHHYIRRHRARRRSVFGELIASATAAELSRGDT